VGGGIGIKVAQKLVRLFEFIKFEGEALVT
jgi:hypothetical protein